MKKLLLLAALMAACGSRTVSATEFIDNPSQCRDKTIEVGPVYYDGSGRLPDARGKVASFHYSSASFKSYVVDGAELPNAGASEPVVLRITCDNDALSTTLSARRVR